MGSKFNAEMDQFISTWVLRRGHSRLTDEKSGAWEGCLQANACAYFELTQNAETTSSRSSADGTANG